MAESVGETGRREMAEGRGEPARETLAREFHTFVFDLKLGKVRVFHRPGSPWVEVEVPDGAIAIWATTGAVHPVTRIGAVTDDPITLPFPNDDLAARPRVPE